MAIEQPLWQANYKSMSVIQLTTELERIAKHSHFYDDMTERAAFIARELALRYPLKTE